MTKSAVSIIAALTIAVVLAVIGSYSLEMKVASSDARNVGRDASVEKSPLTPFPADDSTPHLDVEEYIIDACRDRVAEGYNADTSIDGLNTESIDGNNDPVVRHARNLLAASDSVDHNFAAALLQEDLAASAQAFTEILSTEDEKAAILFRAILICQAVDDKNICLAEKWERKLLAIDLQNSEAWMRVAANRYDRGELEEALRALEQAAASVETRTYLATTIEAVEHALAAAGNVSFQERVALSIRIAGSQIPSFGIYTDMCRIQSALSEEWAYACLRYGELLERQSDTLIGGAIGLAIQRVALESLGATAQLE